MNKADLNEAVALVEDVLTALLATMPVQSGTAGAQLKWAVGRLAANAGAELDVPIGTEIAPLWADLAGCFDQARLAGATFGAMDSVRAVAEAAAPVGAAAIAVKNFCVRMALAEQAQILAATTFVSREDVDAVLDRINAAFDLAETVAADNRDNVAYRALVTLHARVANDLSTRSRPLPRLVSYGFPVRMPALWMAQRLYQDPTRAAELVAENKAVHPLFMPQAGLALST